jgi:ribosome biogenesis GTP-binding protein ylqF
VLDARIPLSSRNPEIKKLVGDKPIISVFNKISLADPDITARWRRAFEEAGGGCAFTDCTTGAGIKELPGAVRELLADKLARFEEKGMSGRAVRAMVVGIPNVGKSSLINRLAGAKKARTEDRPGVTLKKQWIKAQGGLDLLDMPGVLWPKFEEKRVGENLALTGAIRDAILDTEGLAVILCNRLRELYPDLLCARYKLGGHKEIAELTDYELFQLIGRKRGFLVSGGEVSDERTAVMLLDEFRGSKIGRISLERPMPGKPRC